MSTETLEHRRLEAFLSADLSASDLEGVIELQKQVDEGSLHRFGALALVGAEVKYESVSNLSLMAQEDAGKLEGALVLGSETVIDRDVEILGASYIRNSVITNGSRVRASTITGSEVDGRSSVEESTIESGSSVKNRSRVYRSTVKGSSSVTNSSSVTTNSVIESHSTIDRSAVDNSRVKSSDLTKSTTVTGKSKVTSTDMSGCTVSLDSKVRSSDIVGGSIKSSSIKRSCLRQNHVEGSVIEYVDVPGNIRLLDAHITDKKDIVYVNSVGTGNPVYAYRSDTEDTQSITIQAGCKSFYTVRQMLKYARKAPEYDAYTREQRRGFLREIRAFAELVKLRLETK